MAKEIITGPAPPPFLSGPALEKWAELLELNPGTWNLDHVAAYCAAYGRWRRAEEWLADPDNGPVITIRDDKGVIRSHGPAPQLTISQQSAKELARIDKILDLSWALERRAEEEKKKARR